MIPLFTIVYSLLLLCTSSSNAQTLQRVLFTSDVVAQTGARCVNGSPSGYYFGAATSAASKTKWYIYLDGGGYCLISPEKVWPNVQDCAARATTTLGDSSKWGATRARITSYSVSDWNQVSVPYCGGDLHSGTLMEPSHGLYNAGHLTIAAIIKDITALHGFGAATDVIFTGDSAGGIGVITNGNFVHKLVPSANFRLFPNAGWFLGLPPYNPNYITNSFELIYKTSQAYLDPLCTATYKDTPWLCFVGNYTFQFFTMPVFIANSIFDSNALVDQAGIPNPGTTWPNPQVNEFAVEKAQVANNTLLQVLKYPKSGIFSTSAFTHVLSPTNTIRGHTLSSVFAAWLNGDTSQPWVVMDSCKTPDCRNITLPTTHSF